ncbi:MAG: methylmalonyl-CoA mutase family protein [Chitinophagales bacterium]
MSIAFHKPNIAEVKALIQKELRLLPLDSLAIQVGENQSLSPIYTNSNKSHKIPYLLDYKVIFQLFSLTSSQAETNNRDLMEALENGQNGLILNFKHQDWTLEQLNPLFLKIRLDYVHTEFLNTNSVTEKSIIQYLNNNYINLSWNNSALSKEVYCISDENFYSAAANFIKSFRGEKAFIHIELSGDYFRDIAKIRAFKTLLYQHRRLEGLSTDFLLIGETNLNNKTKENPENNILKLTTEAMSALIGGCEGIWIRPHDNQTDSKFSTRIARNIFHLMQEEAYMHLVNDVSSGSYFIEEYTEMVAREIYLNLGV